MIKNTTIMIKILADIIVVAAVATVTGWNINQSMNEVKLSDLALANIEATAQNEGAQVPTFELVYNDSTKCYVCVSGNFICNVSDQCSKSGGGC